MEEFDWIKDTEKIYNIKNNHFEKIYQPNIKFIFVYINNNNYINKITKNIISLDDNIITNESIMKIIYNNRIVSNNSIYNFNDLFLLNIDIDHDKLNEFNNLDIFNYNNSSFFKQLNIDNDIVIPKTLFIFHNINSIFIFYKEKLIDTKPKSIIKKNNKSSTSRPTKKVSIKDTFRKTKKKQT